MGKDMQLGKSVAQHVVSLFIGMEFFVLVVDCDYDIIQHLQNIEKCFKFYDNLDFC